MINYENGLHSNACPEVSDWGMLVLPAYIAQFLHTPRKSVQAHICITHPSCLELLLVRPAETVYGVGVEACNLLSSAHNPGSWERSRLQACKVSNPWSLQIERDFFCALMWRHAPAVVARLVIVCVIVALRRRRRAGMSTARFPACALSPGHDRQSNDSPHDLQSSM